MLLCIFDKTLPVFNEAEHDVVITICTRRHPTVVYEDDKTDVIGNQFDLKINQLLRRQY